MAAERVTIQCENQVAEIARLHDEVAAFAASHALSEEILWMANLALDEIAANVIRYAYPENERHHFHVRLALEQGSLVLEVEDEGQAFNPLDRPAPDVDMPIEDRPIGGLGIYLVKQVMDEVTYQRHDGKNLLVMKKRVG